MYSDQLVDFLSVFLAEIGYTRAHDPIKNDYVRADFWFMSPGGNHNLLLVRREEGGILGGFEECFTNTSVAFLVYDAGCLRRDLFLDFALPDSMDILHKFLKGIKSHNV